MRPRFTLPRALSGPGRTKHGIHAALADARRYERQIDRLHQRHLYDGGLHSLIDGEINLATVVLHRNHVARLLARSVERGEHAIRPATVRSILVEGKRRSVFEYPLFDLIVHGVVAEILAEAVEPALSSSVYSYRTGVSSVTGVSAFARYLRRHSRSRPDPRTRGVYVLRRDVDSYTDSIPLGSAAPIWAQLREAVERTGGPAASLTDWQLIESVVRPLVLTDDGTTATHLRGVATGQPISCVCFNVNLSGIDVALRDIPGSFYARYSDDLVFVHPDPDVARAASEMLDERITGLGLSFNVDKRRDLYVTGAGRASTEWPEARGTTGVVFLGMRVAFDGTVALSPHRVRRLLSEARRRAANTAEALDGEGLAARGAAITKAVNTVLDPEDAQLQGAAALVLARVVTDRRQLEQLDHELAQIVASTATGTSGPRSFRRAPYSQVRSQWRLRSLRRSRDRSIAK